MRGVPEWVRKAEADYRVALRELGVTVDASPGAVSFHAQQCMERTRSVARRALGLI